VTRWRMGTVVVLLLGIGLPLAMPFLDVARHPQVWRVWDESDRLWQLAKNTLQLVAGTLAIAMPIGVAGAVLLYRSNLPLRGFFRSLTILTLFVPLPLAASAWQATLGTTGWLPLAVWSTPPPGDPDVSPGGIVWKPWAQGMWPAFWVHAVAALPWVVWLVGQGLCWVERELEEDALLLGRPSWVFCFVTLPRCRATLVVAALWIALQTATEITVTDMMSVRTFAEEVYTQFVRPDTAPLALGESRDVLGRAMAVSMPCIALTWLLVVWAARRWERSLPPQETASSPLCLFRLGWARWPLLILVMGVVGLVVGVPVASLVWKAGLSGSPESWSAITVWKHLQLVGHGHWSLLVQSLAVAGAAGMLTAGLALVTCWLASESRKYLLGLLVLVGAAWAMPGPVVGIGLKECISGVVEAEAFVARTFGIEPEELPQAQGEEQPRSQRGAKKSEDDGGPPPSQPFRPLAKSLYYGPSPAPLMWAFLVRFFPFAVAMLWPVVRLLPPELRDAARVDGARPWQEFVYVILPLTFPALIRAALAVAVLSLGELSAGKLAETPGFQTLAHVIFEQMHYGVTNNLAALCLILLLTAGGGGGTLVLLGRLKPRLGMSRSEPSA